MAAAATARAPTRMPATGPRPRLGHVPDVALSSHGREWPRGLVLSLAQRGCSYCHGLGMLMLKTRWGVCPCVFREAFRQCLRQWRAYQNDPGRRISRCRLYKFWRNGVRFQTWGRPTEEYIADFCLVAQRHLTPMQWRVFWLHHVQRRPWGYCAPKLELSRGNFFHEVYRIEVALGRACCETKPYGLYPPNDYPKGQCH